MADRYIVVLTNLRTTPENLAAYLYGHTVEVERVADDRHAAYLLRTTADNPDRAEFLVNYQADRLSSALMGAAIIAPYTSDEDASARMGKLLDQLRA